MKLLFNRCARYRESISLLASGALPKLERGEVESHLAACADCRKYYDEVKSLTAPLTGWERDFAQIEPSLHARTRWAKAIKATKASQRVRPVSAQLLFRAVWHELIWPCRRVWIGMAALWFVMLWINLGQSDHRAAGLEARTKPAPGMWQALEEQRRLLAELIPPVSSRPPEPRRREPGPRSERPGVWTAMSASPHALVRADLAVRAPVEASDAV